MKKGTLLQKVQVTGIAHKGQAIGRDDDGQVVFMTGAVPGDLVDVQLTRRKKGVWQGIPVHYHRRSEKRQKPVCRHFEDCGGCKWQHLKYLDQLEHKQMIVRDAFKRIAKVEVKEALPIIGMNTPFHYRNKMELSFSVHRWKTKDEVDSSQLISQRPALGFHPPGFFDKVVDVTECWLQDQRADEIRNFIRDFAHQNQLTFFDPRTHQGFLRNLIIRNTTLDQWMVTIVFFYEDVEKQDSILEALAEKFVHIDSIQYVINEKKNDSLFDQQFHVFHGPDYIEESLGSLKFRIGPKSFFQTNSSQAEQLYNVARSFCQLKGDEVVYDLYTGIGSIALFVADQCSEVIGIEEVESAVIDARINAELNNIGNAHFFCGDVRSQWQAISSAGKPRPDVIITDPPRAGMHEEVVQHICQLQPDRVVYISCNPSTQARDIARMSERYRIHTVQPVDMFPHTSHIENVALLIRK